MSFTECIGCGPRANRLQDYSWSLFSEVDGWMLDDVEFAPPNNCETMCMQRFLVDGCTTSERKSVYAFDCGVDQLCRDISSPKPVMSADGSRPKVSRAPNGRSGGGKSLCDEKKERVSFDTTHACPSASSTLKRKGEHAVARNMLPGGFLLVNYSNIFVLTAHTHFENSIEIRWNLIFMGS